MPNQITAAGIETKTQAELITEFTAAFELAYGADIDLDQDTPDGQMMMNFIQATLDVEDLITNVNAMFDPDQAVGVILDQRVAINGIQRNEGTYTITNITVTTSEALTLYGLDQDDVAPYTVQDNTGIQWYLEETQTPGGAGTYIYVFRAAEKGATPTIPNTINIPVTIVLGVDAINNPTTYTTLGTDQETDAVLRVRRQRSVSIGSQGYYNSLYAALTNIAGVTSATISENYTGDTNGDGVPGHSIWVIVAGTGADSDIAQAIYSKRNAGCGLYSVNDSGSKSYTITQVDGTFFVVVWDTVVAEDLFIKFTATSLDGVNPPDIAGIKAYLVENFVPGVDQQVNITALGTSVQDADSNTLVTLAGFSLSAGGSYTNTLDPSNRNRQFAVSAGKIIILPIILSPTTVSAAELQQQQFTPIGGYGPFTYNMASNPSGGSVDSSGLYTAGNNAGVIDVVQVNDSLGNFSTASVVVTP